MNKISILALLLSVSAILAQTPVPCTSPPQWSARFAQYDEETQFFSRGYLAYDSIYKRERIIDEYILQNDREAFDVLRIFNSNIEYVYDFRNKTCKNQPITRAWRDFGIPVNASNFGESYIGSSAVPNANLLATVWGYNFTDSQGNRAFYQGVWTYEACIPISSIVVYPTRAIHTGFFDIVPGIQDPNLFIPRPECVKN